MIKVYNTAAFGGECNRRVKIYGSSAEVWSELTEAMEAIYKAECEREGAVFAKNLLMTCIRLATGEEKIDEEGAAE